MKRGRPKATGPYKTRAELVAGVLERHANGKSMRGIAQILKVSRYNHRKNYQRKTDQHKSPLLNRHLNRDNCFT